MGAFYKGLAIGIAASGLALLALRVLFPKQPVIQTYGGGI
jgi:hypothetical protein